MNALRHLSRYLLLTVLLSPAVHGSDVIEHLGQPCRAKQILGAAVVTDREDGRERLILLDDNETYHVQLLYIDFIENTGKAYAAPAGAGSWGGVEAPGDKFIVGTFYDGVFMIFDLQKMVFEKTVDFPGEQYIWNVVVGADGRVYGGTYPGGKLGALDLTSSTVEDLGNPTTDNLYLRFVSSTPWGQLVAAFMSGDRQSRVYDVASQSWKDMPGGTEGAGFYDGVAWQGYFIAHDPRSGRVEAFKDDTWTPVKTRPFPDPPTGSFNVMANLSNDKTLYFSGGGAVYRYTAGEEPFEAVKIAAIDLRGGRYVAATKDGRLLGVRGQSYFVVKPGDTDLDLRPIPVESKGRPMLFLEGDADGKIWGGPHFGQTLFYYDIEKQKEVNTAVICDAGGEVYDVAFRKGIVYAASYAGGDITRYDPSKPWDQWRLKNPSPVAKVAPEYIRPSAGIMLGPDDKLYAGWMARYGTYGGAVSITDPDGGETELIENPLGKQAIARLAVDRSNLYIGTSLHANGLPPQEGKEKFGVIAIKSRKVLFEREMVVAGIVAEPKTDTVLLNSGSLLYQFDPRSNALNQMSMKGLPGLSGSFMIAVGDGTILASAGNSVVHIDVVKQTFEVVLEADAPIEAFALGTDDRVYFAHGPDLNRTKKTINRKHN